MIDFLPLEPASEIDWGFRIFNTKLSIFLKISVLVFSIFNNSQVPFENERGLNFQFFPLEPASEIDWGLRRSGDPRFLSRYGKLALYLKLSALPPADHHHRHHHPNHNNYH